MSGERHIFLGKLRMLRAQRREMPLEISRDLEIGSRLPFPEAPIEHSCFLAAASRIADAHLRFIEDGKGLNILITGQSGSGKSVLINWYLARNPIEERSDFDLIPVLVVSTPSNPSVNNLVQAILRALGAPRSSRESEDEKKHRIITLLKRHGVELIFIDEFQHFLDYKSTATLRITDTLKEIFDACNCAVILVGLPRSDLIVKQNEQMRRRFSRRFELAPFDAGVESSWVEFRAVLRELHRRTPISALPFHEPELARRFYFASEGLISYLVTIVDAAISTARRDQSSIDLKVLGAAFEEAVWPGGPYNLNPFFATGELRPLRGPGEPFGKWDSYKG
jgi:type II secretory pathway predicted ATPase ExeA